ncbi:hypothetical protein HD554DRAFT_82530 [Boletus coccyginus]|nr:hypothetical protein HD554DRAFT_82530 [Boletus coccyginus]
MVYTAFSLLARSVTSLVLPTDARQLVSFSVKGGPKKGLRIPFSSKRLRADGFFAVSPRRHHRLCFVRLVRACRPRVKTCDRSGRLHCLKSVFRRGSRVEVTQVAGLIKVDTLSLSKMSLAIPKMIRRYLSVRPAFTCCFVYNFSDFGELVS